MRSLDDFKFTGYIGNVDYRFLSAQTLGLTNNLRLQTSHWVERDLADIYTRFQHHDNSSMTSTRRRAAFILIYSTNERVQMPAWPTSVGLPAYRIWNSGSKHNGHMVQNSAAMFCIVIETASTKLGIRCAKSFYVRRFSFAFLLWQRSKHFVCTKLLSDTLYA